MPRVNLTTILRERDGGPILDERRNEFSLKQALLRILDAPVSEDQQGVSKLRLAQLGVKLEIAAEEIELTSADTTLILDRAAKIANALIFGQLVMALDPGQLA